jgi:hypothetical protein
MSIGCIAVDSHNCVQTVQKKYLDLFTDFTWAMLVDSDNLNKINSLVESKILIYIKKNQRSYINSTMLPYEDIFLILEQDSELDFQISLANSALKKIYILLPESGACLNLRLKAETTTSLQVNIICDQLAPNTKVIVNGRFYVQGSAKIDICGKIRMPELAKNSASKLIFKCLRENSQSTVKLAPELEVFNHLVKANHGSAIDIIDQKLVWQVMARGISKKNAQLIFKKSFLKDDQCI